MGDGSAGDPEGRQQRARRRMRELLALSPPLLDRLRARLSPEHQGIRPGIRAPRHRRPRLLRRDPPDPDPGDRRRAPGPAVARPAGLPGLASHRRAARHRRPRRRRGRRHPLPRARRRAPALERAGTAHRLRHRPDHRGPRRRARPQPHPGTRTQGGAARGCDDRRGGGVRLVRGRPGRGRSRRPHPGRLLLFSLPSRAPR